MDALTLRGFLSIAVLAGVPVGIATVVGFLRSGEGLAPSVLVGGMALLSSGGVVAACFYLVQILRDFSTLHLGPEDLLRAEQVVMETPHSIVHYRRGRKGGPFDSIGGRLVLTTHRLVFLAHRGQPHHYRLSLTLADISGLESAGDVRGFPGELAVTTLAGERELFTFGAIRRSEPDRWVAAISQARDRCQTGD